MVMYHITSIIVKVIRYFPVPYIIILILVWIYNFTENSSIPSKPTLGGFLSVKKESELLEVPKAARDVVQVHNIVGPVSYTHLTLPTKA